MTHTAGSYKIKMNFATTNLKHKQQTLIFRIRRMSKISKISIPSQVYSSFHKESRKLYDLIEYLTICVREEKTAKSKMQETADKLRRGINGDSTSSSASSAASGASESSEIYIPIRVNTDMLTTSTDELVQLASALPSSQQKTVSKRKWEARKTRIETQMRRINSLKQQLQDIRTQKVRLSNEVVSLLETTQNDDFFLDRELDHADSETEDEDDMSSVSSSSLVSSCMPVLSIPRIIQIARAAAQQFIADGVEVHTAKVPFRMLNMMEIASINADVARAVEGDVIVKYACVDSDKMLVYRADTAENSVDVILDKHDKVVYVGRWNSQCCYSPLSISH